MDMQQNVHRRTCKAERVKRSEVKDIHASYIEHSRRNGMNNQADWRHRKESNDATSDGGRYISQEKRAWCAQRQSERSKHSKHKMLNHMPA